MKPHRPKQMLMPVFFLVLDVGDSGDDLVGRVALFVGRGVGCGGGAIFVGVAGQLW